IEYIDDVTVQTIKNGSNNELVAYVVVPDFEGDIIEYVKDYMRQNKPDYMVPSFVVSIDEIPVNINGKVDKRALPKIDVSALRSEYVAPRNKLEKDIVHAFEDVFNQEKISIYDNFSRLGGDSLIAIKIISHLNDYNITAADILSLGSPKVIAENINDAPIDLDLYSIDEGCPLNESQLNVYLDIIANEKTDSYLIPLKMNISKKYSIDTICNGLNEILNVHPILKMCINDSYSVPYLVKGNNPKIKVKNDADERFINNFITEGFDLKTRLCKFLINEKPDKYELSCVFHHLIFDGLSKSVFKQDLLNILNGNKIDIDDSFLKISAFNQQIQKTDEYGEAKDYYDSMLAESDEIETLLNDVTSDGPGMCEHELDIDLKQFNEFISKNYINENVLFTSVFAYTLSRFTGNDKVLFNIVENGRDRFNNFDSIGMFVNTLPILADCKNQSVSTFISTMSDLIYSVMRYNYYPFRLLANEHNINANIIFQYLPDWFNENNTDDLDNADLIKDSQDMISDLSVIVDRKDDNYTLNIIYSNKYSEKTIKRIIDAYNLILSQIINANNLSDINYITKEDLELLDNYNKTEHELKYNDILDAFNDSLSKYPKNTLVSYKDTSYTYSEGAFIAHEIAKQLIDLGVDSQDCVGFLVERSEYYMFAVLGTMSMGGIYVPLDDNLPDERIKFILNDTKSEVVIVSDETYDRVNNLSDNITLLNISDIMEDIGTLSTLPVAYGDLACILYTSGTTGIPKGVKITRKSIVNLSQYYEDTYNLTKDDVYGLYSAIGFDAATQALCLCIYSGSCLSVIPDDIKLNIVKLNDYFTEQNITHTLITTQIGKMFINTIESTSLDVLLVGGEKLGEIESPKNYLLADAYGPTESCVFVLTTKNSDKIDSSSLGSLNYNTKAYILDNEGRRVPIGAVGELYLAGNQLAKGYLNREEETERAFLENPFDGGIMYRTGDIVRLLSDGSFGIIGRRDGQVKIRGNRVELTEIESTIREIDIIEDVTIQTIKNGSNNELVAYVVAANDIDSDDLNELISTYIGERKPNYMIPSFIIKLDKIPINVNGKVDKKALPEVDFDSLHAEYAAPTNKIEEDIVNAFEKVFNQKKISIYDNFSRLGGDSLIAIKVISQLNDYNITAADILNLGTPKEIAENISDTHIDLDLYSVDEGCPLNEPQLNVYLDIIANNKTDSYLILVNMDIPNKYSIDELHNALNEMANVHPILKMHINDNYSVPHLVKGNNPEIIVKNDADERFINNFITEGFDLEKSLCKFLINEKTDEYELFGVFHHLIFD
ncbi:AMP-binding protein, partial [uncultured Methanobrevibacter sp.]|uniref:AMP-binding protein n=1 Tax=uncultured Methanobrevibacter sp. TaxID=253161 RepID=UPI0025F98931